MGNKFIVNGVESNLTNQICTRCVQDKTVPGISFDKKGVCNYCDLHDSLCEIFPNDERGEIYLSQLFSKIKNKFKK